MEIDVEHVARLARLGLTAEEKTLFGKQLAAILEYADNLKKLDTKDIPPSAHAIPLNNILRADKAEPCANIAEIMANAPAEEEHMFLVPRIME